MTYYDCLYIYVAYDQGIDPYQGLRLSSVGNNPAGHWLWYPEIESILDNPWRWPRLTSNIDRLKDALVKRIAL